MRNTSASAITFLHKIVPNAKHLQKLGTLEVHIIRKKRGKILSCFYSKVDVGKKERKKKTFHNGTIIAVAFP